MSTGCKNFPMLIYIYQLQPVCQEGTATPQRGLFRSALRSCEGLSAAACLQSRLDLRRVWNYRLQVFGVCGCRASRAPAAGGGSHHGSCPAALCAAWLGREVIPFKNPPQGTSLGRVYYIL